jgi:hypothetical protein
MEKQTFQTDVTLLGLGIKTQTVNYSYQIEQATQTAVVNVAYPLNTVVLRAYTGGVSLGRTQTKVGGEDTMLTVLCQSQQPQAGSVDAVSFTKEDGPFCTSLFEDLGK